MKKHSILLLFSVAMFLGLASCDDDNERKKVPIRSVEGTASFDVSDRADWTLLVGGYKYRLTVDGKKISGLPTSEDLTWHTGSQTWDKSFAYDTSNDHPLGSTMSGYGMDLRILLMPSDTEITEGFDIRLPPTADVLDQSTARLLQSADILAVWFKYVDKEHLTNLQFEHHNNFIQYKLEGFPEGAEVKLMSGKSEIQPLVVDGVAKAIVSLPIYNTIEYTVGDKTYSLPLATSLLAHTEMVKTVNGIYYTFTVKYDKDAQEDAKKLTLEKVTAVNWTKSELGQK